MAAIKADPAIQARRFEHEVYWDVWPTDELIIVGSENGIKSTYFMPENWVRGI